MAALALVFNEYSSRKQCRPTRLGQRRTEAGEREKIDSKVDFCFFFLFQFFFLFYKTRQPANNQFFIYNNNNVLGVVPSIPIAYVSYAALRAGVFGVFSAACI